jgi:hypothetical protein
MTKQLYEEALADVKKLREVAEGNAMRAVFEAVTPRIKDLIENELLREPGLDGDPDDESLLFDDEAGLPGTDTAPMVPAAVASAAPLPGTSMSVGMPGESVPETTPLGSNPGMTASTAPITPTAAGVMPSSMPAVSLDSTGAAVLDLGQLTSEEQPLPPLDGEPMDELPPGEDDVYELSFESAVALGAVLSNVDKREAPFAAKTKKLVEETRRLVTASKMIKESAGYASVIDSTISKVENTYAYLQENLTSSARKKDYENALERCFQTLKKLTEQNMNKTGKNKLSEGKLTFTIDGLPDDIEDSLEGLNIEIEAPAGEEGEEGGDELDLGGDEGGEGDELDLGGDEEGGDDGAELDLGGDDEDKMESRKLSDDTIVEISESMLRREISRMKALREEKDMPKNAPKGHGAGKVAKGFQEKDEGDPFEHGKVTTESDGADDADDKKKDLDEVDGCVDELDEYDGMGQATDHSNDDEQTNKQNRMPEAFRRRLAAERKLQAEARERAASAKKRGLMGIYEVQARRFNESVARVNAMKSRLAEAGKKVSQNGSSTGSAENQKLRAELAEKSLFNAKLLYANKLLQNESLTKRQKAEMIERLDEAKNDREVKLVYESLVKTLQSTKKLSEGSDRALIGSSSRASRPASATSNLNESYEADRWARLAGIIK